ncbi:MAG: endonuclease domain-containing protein [Candidatus Shapirobacteria bacterium]|nr:endonuclease domain-containing protein [Candidatus Shapirobacteria bacterium]
MKITEDNFLTKRNHLRYLEELRILAKKNRNNPTEAEYIMWRYLRKSKYKFTRQKPINRFILVFYCSEINLAIEIDGDSHNKKKSYDLLRDRYLESVNIKTLRFKNNEVLNNFDEVLKRLLPFLRGDVTK